MPRHNRINWFKSDSSSQLLALALLREENLEVSPTTLQEETVDLHCSWEGLESGIGHAVGLAMLVDDGSVEVIMMFAGCPTAMGLWCECEWSLQKDCVERCDLQKGR